jgi:hypothetical protein
MNQIPPEALWVNRSAPRNPSGEKFPGPRPPGRCMIPPRGLTFREYNPIVHGPLVPCRYDTAAYIEGPVL